MKQSIIACVIGIVALVALLASTNEVTAQESLENGGCIVKFHTKIMSAYHVPASDVTTNGKLKPEAANFLSRLGTYDVRLPIIAVGLTSSKAIMYAIDETALLALSLVPIVLKWKTSSATIEQPAHVTVGTRQFRQQPRLKVIFAEGGPHALMLLALEDKPISIIRRNLKDIAKEFSRISGYPLIVQLGETSRSLIITSDIVKLNQELCARFKKLPEVKYVQNADINMTF